MEGNTFAGAMMQAFEMYGEKNVSKESRTGWLLPSFIHSLQKDNESLSQLTKSQMLSVQGRAFLVAFEEAFILCGTKADTTEEQVQNPRVRVLEPQDHLNDQPG